MIYVIFELNRRINMIDLHIHTKYSDGTDTMEELLQKAEELNLKYISITDHDNCNALELILHKSMIS